MRKSILVGNTVDEKLKHVDIILDRLSRRAVKTASATVTPTPIFAYVDIPDEKPILRYMFPWSGTILRGYIFIETMPKSGVNVVTSIVNPIGSMGRTFFVKKNASQVELMNNVNPGDRIFVSIEKVNVEEVIGGIWLSFAWMPVVSNELIKQFIIDDLDEQGKYYAGQGEENE